MIPLPSTTSDLAEISGPLDATDHATRVAWMRGLGRAQQYALFKLAGGKLRVAAADLVADTGVVVVHEGKNGLAAFTRFQKRCVRLTDGTLAGYNDNADNGPLAFLVAFFAGPGHYTFYDAPGGEGEVWIDYRTVAREQHPDFPPLTDNDHGLRSLTFGNLVDVLRRVSRDVYVGDSFKDKSPPLTLGHRIGKLLPTAPFVLVTRPKAGPGSAR